MSAPETTESTLAGPKRNPRHEEIDVYGITHPGKVRKENQDHFLICALKNQMVIQGTSLPHTEHLLIGPQRFASLMIVADGVGGSAKGADASRLALEAVTQYVAHSSRCYYAASAQSDEEFTQALQEAAVLCHAQLLRQGVGDPEYRGMATTLTLYLGAWPRAYLLQVGDSRCYMLRQGELTQMSRDQTMAEDLVDLGVLTRADASKTRLAHTLSSSIGGRSPAPVVTALAIEWGTTVMLCSDGLTKHVSDERIRERLRSMTSAKQACEDLLAEALDGGGTDNITMIVARALPSE